MLLRLEYRSAEALTRRPRISVDQGLAPQGFADLVALALLDEVRHLARRGLLSAYVFVEEEISTPRGRIDIRRLACTPPVPRVHCRYEDFTSDHALHRALKGGLYMAAAVAGDRQLSLDLVRMSERLLPDVSRMPLSRPSLEAARRMLDRRSSHYERALSLVELLYAGQYVEDEDRTATTRLPGFLLDMNKLFERFLERTLQERAPPSWRVIAQDARSRAYRWTQGSRGWQAPRVQPDLQITRGGRVVLIGDAKYKNHDVDRPTTGELYQLTTYGLAFGTDRPVPTLLLYPTTRPEVDDRSVLRFRVLGSMHTATIRMVGVPVTRVLEDPTFDLWEEVVAPLAGERVAHGVC